MPANIIERSAASRANTTRVRHLDCPGGGQVWVDGTTLYIGHMHWPSGTSIVDVADPRCPRLLAGIDIPEGWHSHKVRVHGGVMLVNHETGAIQSVGDLAASLSGTAPMHCDAAAAAGKMSISFRQLGVTSLTVTAHKFHGPKGIGALMVRKQANLNPLFFGGHQQHSKRPGTEPVALAVGLAAALQWAVRHLETHRLSCLALRRRFLGQWCQIGQSYRWERAEARSPADYSRTETTWRNRSR